ncbi:MAG: methyltransferase domain-containing protein [Nitrospirae bacterium]|nr:methyltransferase domain-containing protein [Nitrospirota bacterium]
MKKKDINHLPCGHDPDGIEVKGYRARCISCGSFWDIDYFGDDFLYDSEYPEARHHFDEAIGRLKVKTLRRWLSSNAVSTSGLAVCEVGFGGGTCLKYLAENSSAVYGIEVVDANLDHARSIGIRNVYKFTELPEKLSDKIDLWIFQDSFEHITKPRDFVPWMVSNSSDDAKILLVSPEAGSMSERILGRFWPHKLEDHRFHWSQKGVVGFFDTFGFRFLNNFYPLKYISMNTVISHILFKFRLRPLSNIKFPAGDMLSFPFNFGEMGLLLQRRK